MKMRSAALSNAVAGSTGTSCSLSFFPPRMHQCNTISCRPRFLPKILALSTNDIKVGTNIEVDGAPWRVMEFLHVKPGKGAAFVRTKLRNYVFGNTVDKTFRAGASVDLANIVKETKQYTYKDGAQFVFMDMSTYDESRLSETEIGDKKKWLKEGMECNVLSWNGRIIDVEFPITVKYKVTEAEAGVKGDTVQGGSKLVTLETGAVVNVPLFVNLGDEILVDTRTGTYTSRA
ncbi:uncharacterized protein LOC131076835 [Cryptomeria japonica]|uniref:uncharacterized protein LOC131076835 n=1 Tax=Cryptomeria japonica TaxID=3369 RepID=UPI0025AD5121|nr:uncharacterized protein LOC131076835 [Cryptomeria japonica]